MASVLVNIDVPDLERATDFYTRAFELEVSRRLGQGAVELGGAECKVYLLRTESGSAPYPGARETRRFERHWTPVHLDFVVADLERAVERATAAGATLERAPRAEVWGKLAVLADPFGNGFCLIQLTGRGYDALVE